MPGALERAIAAAMDDLWGDDHAPAEPKSSMRDPLRLKAIAAAPDQDADAVDLLERHFALQVEVDEFAVAIGDLMKKHPDDESFARRCRKALYARADLVGLQQRELLRAWEPTLHHTFLPT